MNIPIPIFQNTGKYSLIRLRKDLLAALIVTSIAIPESMGFAVIVGVPVQNGLYCALLAPIIYALLAKSRRLVVGADSATAAIVASGAATVATAASPDYMNAIIVLGLLTGVLLIIMGAFKMGFIADLISRPVLLGFFAGVGLQLIVAKLPEMLGLEPGKTFLSNIQHTVTQIGDLHIESLILALAVLAAIYFANRFRYPGALIGLVVGTLLSIVFGLEELGVKTVGEIPTGLPSIALPYASVGLVVALLPAAAAIAVVILAQSTAVVRTFANKHDEKINDSQDLIALGFANAASAVTSGFAINGSPPRTAAAEIGGGSSQMVNIFMAFMVAGMLLFASGLVSYIPLAALAAVVFSIGLHLIDTGRLEDIYMKRRTEFWIAMIAMIGVAIFGVLYGVIIAVLASLIERLHRQYHPEDIILLRDRKLDEAAAARLHTQNQFTKRPAGIVVYQFKDSLFFENSSYFRQRVNEVIEGAKEPVRYFVLDAASINDIDYTGAHTLKHLINNLRSDDINFCISHVSPLLREKLDEYDLIEIIGKRYIYKSLNDAFVVLASNKQSSLEKIREIDIAKQHYVVIGGAALELRGIRKTNDVDLVVTRSVYNHYKQRRTWREFVSDDGKHTLWHEGYVLMTKWMGKDVAHLKRDAEIIDGIPVMSLRELLRAKRALGRRKDKRDIELIEDYMARHSKPKPKPEPRTPPAQK